MTVESDIESAFVKFCLKLHIACPKLRLASESAWPDRTLLYKGRTMFMELKRKGEKPTPLQEYTLDTLIRAGFEAHWADELHVMKHLVLDWKRRVDEHLI